MDTTKPIRLTSVMHAAEVLLLTASPRQAAVELEAEYGWDLAFQALLLLRQPAAEQALLASLDGLLAVTD